MYEKLKSYDCWRKLSFGIEFDRVGGISLSRNESECDYATREFCIANGLEGKPIVVSPFHCIVAYEGGVEDPELENVVRMIFSEHLEKCEHAFHLDGMPFKSPIIVPDHPHPSCPFNPLEPFVRPPVKPGDWPPSPFSWKDFPPDDGNNKYVVTNASMTEKMPTGDSIHVNDKSRFNEAETSSK